MIYHVVLYIVLQCCMILMLRFWELNEGLSDAARYFLFLIEYNVKILYLRR